MTTQRSITTFALVMLITGAVDSIRNLPTTALFGTSLIFFLTFAAIVFLIPTALISAELASTNQEKSGIYEWINAAFGKKWAFLAIWLQWITNLVWFPTILSFIASLVAYLIEPSLAQNKLYLVSVILITFWAITFLNLRGLHVSAVFTSFCTVIGMVIPMTLFISLAIVWLLQGKPTELQFTLSNMLPSFQHINNWVSLTAIMTAFAGMELAAVHIKEMRDPQTTFPRALFISVWLILVTMILGSLAIALVLPHSQISLVNGVMQAFSAFFAAYHLHWLIPIMTFMILIGSLGGIISWVISPAKGLLQAAQMGFLPPFFQKVNRHGVAANLLIAQAVLVSLVCLAFLLMPSVSGSYWLLTDLSTQLYMFMYLMLFSAGIYLRYKAPLLNRHFKIPGGKIGIWLVTLLGFMGCIITLVVGFFPPDGIDVGGTMHYEVSFCCGMLVMILPILFFYWYKARFTR